MEVIQENVYGFYSFTITIDGCIVHYEYRNTGKEINFIKITAINLLHNHSLFLYQNLSIFTKECNVGKDCIDFCKQRRKHVKTVSLTSPYLYPVNIANAKLIPNGFDLLYPFKLSKNLTLCRQTTTNKVYVSSKGYISRNVPVQ